MQMEELLGKTREELQRVKYWQHGNGARGAEQRLQSVEVAIDTLEGCVMKDAEFAELRDLIREVKKPKMTWDEWLKLIALIGAVIGTIAANIV